MQKEKSKDKKENLIKKITHRFNKKNNNKNQKSKKRTNITEKIKKKITFKEEKENNYSFKDVMIIMFFSLGLGFITCLSFVKIFSNGRDYIALSKDLEKLVDTYYAIKDNYYGNLDKKLLVDSAIEGMINAVGDSYTIYTDKDDTTSFVQTVSGIYDGIGCTVAVDLNKNIIVVDIFKDSPAEKSGLKVNDIILKIDDNDFQDKTSTDMSNYITNSKNKEVKLLVKRNDEEKEIIVKREKIEIPYVDGEIITKDNNKIAYINISLFSQTSNEQFKKVLIDLEKEDIKGLIIDVRGNSGGYLSSVTDIASMFLKKGDILYQLQDEKGTTAKKDTTKEKRDYKVAVLVNKGSASASEILASIIKESYKGYVVGTNTYGKGTVQQTTKLPDGSMIKYTTQNWLTPEGNWINEIGVTPTDIVELDENYLNNPTRENDTQLNKAIELILK